MIIRATTTPGLEDVSRAEGARLLAAAGLSLSDVANTPGPTTAAGTPAADDPFASPGVVCWVLAAHHAFRDVGERSPLSAARSLYHVAVHVAELAWDGRTLASLIAALEAVDLEEMTRAKSFRVSCSRVGAHDFHSPEVEREAGSVLQARYRTDVDLERYTLHVKIDIVDERAFAGYQLTGRKGLDRRHRWVFHPRVTLRTPIAYGMLVLSGYAESPGALHDPFCGSGTILLEAAGVCRDRGADTPPLSGSDWDARAVSGARANLNEAGLDAVAVSQHDAQDLRGFLEPASLDYIVTNPPFGIRIGKGANLLSMYRDFLAGAAVVLRPRGRLAMLVARRRGAFNKVLATFPEFTIEHVRVVEMGGVYAGLFVLRRNIDPPSNAE
jgi:putative N6-adenine-specific DNA methylase/tRNA (guanine6-N2)-methyltransferase